MHIYFWLRGNPYYIELWKDLMKVQFWLWRRTNLKTKKEIHKLVQGSLRPTIWGAYEYILPEEALSTFLSLIGVTNEGMQSYDMNSQFKQAIGKMKMSVIRKMFNCKRIKKKIYNEAKNIPYSIELTNSERGLSNIIVPGVAIHLIGIKKDRRADFFHPIEAPDGYFQEML